MSNEPRPTTIEKIFDDVLPTLIRKGLEIPPEPQLLANHLRKITSSRNKELMYLLASKCPAGMIIAAHFDKVLDMPDDAHKNAHFERIMAFLEVINHFLKVDENPTWSLDVIQGHLETNVIMNVMPDPSAHIVRYSFRTVFESSKTLEHLYRSYVVVAKMLDFPIDENYSIEDFKKSINMNGEYYSELGESVLRHIDNMLRGEVRGEAGLIAWG